ncbi:MAG: hypothetical protein ACREX3_13890, partial [Gammaproteobacteria bacterium]
MMSLQVRYRPVRIGWCVESGNWDHLRTALHLTHCFAGGKYNPIIPVDHDQLAEYLLDRFHVDVLFPAAETRATRAFIDAHDYLPWPEYPKEQLFYEEENGSPPRARFVDIYHAARRVREERGRDRAKPERRVSVFTWDDDDPLAAVLLSTVGAYPAPSASIPDYLRLLNRGLAVEPIHLNRERPLPEDLNTGLTPARLGAHGLKLWGGAREPGFYVGHAGVYDDILNFWNLRAAGTELVFFDPQQVARLTAVIEEHQRWLESLPARVWDHSRKPVVWVRTREEDYDLSALRVEVIRCKAHAEIWNGLNFSTATPFWDDASVLGSVDTSGRNPSITFALPNKPTYDEIGLSHEFMAVSIRGSDLLLDEGNATFSPPFIPELNEHYGRKLWFLHHDQVRAEPEDIWRSVRLLVPIDIPDVTLDSLPSIDVIKMLFK